MKRKKGYFWTAIVVFFIILVSIFILRQIAVNRLAQCNNSFRSMFTSGSLVNLPDTIECFQDVQKIWPPYLRDEELKQTLVQLQSIKKSDLEKPDITIYFKNKTNNKEVESFAREMQSLVGVKKVNTILQDEALKIYQDQNKSNPLLVQMITKDVLPSSIEVYLIDPVDATLKKEIEQKAKINGFIDQVIYKNPNQILQQNKTQ